MSNKKRKLLYTVSSNTKNTRVFFTKADGEEYEAYKIEAGALIGVCLSCPKNPSQVGKFVELLKKN